MGITIPRRAPSAGGSRQPRGQTPSPSGGDVPVVNPGVARDPGLRVSPEAFGASTGRGLQQLGGTTEETGLQLGAAQVRMQSRQDAVERARAIGSYNEAAAAELRRLETEADLSSNDVVDGYGEFLEQQRDTLLKQHGGSEDSRMMLEAQLENMRVSYADRGAVASVRAQRQLVQSVLGNQLNDLSSNVLADPSSLSDAFSAWDAEIDNMAPGLAPDEELAFRDRGRETMAVSAVEAFLNRGQHEEALALMQQTPGITSSMSPETQRAIQGRIDSFVRAEQEARLAGQNKLIELETMLGRKATPAERARAAGVAQPQQTRQQTFAEKVEEFEAVMGRPANEEEKQRLAGITISKEDRQTAQSPIGKIVEDRQRFVDEYGEDSPQVKAFDELAAAEETGEPPKLTDIAGQRKEFTSLSKDFVAVRDSFNRITAASDTPSAAGDLALMFNYMKMLDPGSVVRESEFATIAATGSFGERLQAAAQTFLEGKRLSDEMRRDFRDRAEMLMQAQIRTQVRLEQQFRSLAARSKMDPADVVIDFLGPFRPEGAPPVPTSEGGSAAQEPPKKRFQADMQGNIIGGVGEGE